MQNCLCVKIRTRCSFRADNSGTGKPLWISCATQKYVPSTENHTKTWQSIINPEVSHPDLPPPFPPNALIWRSRATPSRVSNSCPHCAEWNAYWSVLVILKCAFFAATKDLWNNQKSTPTLCLPCGFNSTLKYTKEFIKNKTSPLRLSGPCHTFITLPVACAEPPPALALVLSGLLQGFQQAPSEGKLQTHQRIPACL